jgi:hypothetical protein
VKLDAILGRGGFNLDRITELEPDFLNPAHGEADHVHDEHCDQIMTTIRRDTTTSTTMDREASR